MRRSMILGLLLILMLPAGCATLGAREDLARRSLYLDAHPKLPPVLREAIENGRLLAGMSREMVAAAVGWPDGREPAQGPGASFERWRYGDPRYDSVVTYLYFGGEALAAYEQREMPTLAVAQARLALIPRDETARRSDLTTASMK